MHVSKHMRGAHYFSQYKRRHSPSISNVQVQSADRLTTGCQSAESTPRANQQTGLGPEKLSTSPVPLSRGLGPNPPLRMILKTTIPMAKPVDSKVRLFAFHSPLLKKSFLANEKVTVSRMAKTPSFPLRVP
ncbi:hypothetical protein DM860_017551 [Cuscuta australis]|uniref:Uncharacterized protein n=1 Tax=Cuscuta australis TaxID=267555 RepID=A0A328DYJ9_9ASTE|nr:hypothetical protein DM860_017551 [Cuscuta australis]